MPLLGTLKMLHHVLYCSGTNIVLLLNSNGLITNETNCLTIDVREEIVFLPSRFKMPLVCMPLPMVSPMYLTLQVQRLMGPIDE